MKSRMECFESDHNAVSCILVKEFIKSRWSEQHVKLQFKKYQYHHNENKQYKIASIGDKLELLMINFS